MASHGVPRKAQQAPQSDDAAHIEAYKSLVKEVQDKIKAKNFGGDTLALTTALLRQNPEYYTVWNYRRLVLQHAIEATAIPDPSDGEPAPGLSPAQHEMSLLLEDDLQFLIPLIKDAPKCYWIWNHRKWLLRQADEQLPVQHAKQFWEGELALDSKMLSYDSRNFHGWSYRREIAAALEACNNKKGVTESVVETEFAYTTKMVKANLSNFSAWHNRSRLLCLLMDDRKADGEARRAFLSTELDFTMQALYTDPADQSLWFYHQCLIDLVAKPESALGNIVPEMPQVERLYILDAQIEMLRDMQEDADDCKWIFQSLIAYTTLRDKLDKRDIDRSNELRSWLDRLIALDPLRRGRWDDMAKTLGV